MFVEQQGGARESGVTLHDGRQLLDVERDGVASVFGSGRIARQHHGDRFANEPHLPIRNDRRFKRRHLGQRKETDRNSRYRPSDLGSRDHRVNAGDRKRVANVERAYSAVRNGAAQDHGVQLAVGVDIVAEGAPATQEPEILDPFNGLADHRFAQIHDVSPVPSVKRRQLVRRHQSDSRAAVAPEAICRGMTSRSASSTRTNKTTPRIVRLTMPANRSCVSMLPFATIKR